MSGLIEEFRAHLASGVTTLCRCWAIVRSDWEVYGFTDHDLPLSFGGIDFKPNTGLTAKAVEQSTGLSIDNTEAMGVLSDAAVSEEDIEVGRFDGARIWAWLVNWTNPHQGVLQFHGSIGELRRSGGAFHAELRGLTDALNQPQGRVFQKPCTAVLGDGTCRFNMATPGYRTEVNVARLVEGRVFYFENLAGFEPEWFKRGRLTVASGSAKGLSGVIKRDVFENGYRAVELWEPVRGGVDEGDRVTLEAGCDKRMGTCRLKFNNLLNFQGFPDLPSDDWVMAVPKQGAGNTGGSRR